MSIKALAIELYRAKQKVDKIRKLIEKEPYEQREILKGDLKAAEQEHQMLRKMLDGRKESGSFKNRFAKFSSFK